MYVQHRQVIFLQKKYVSQFFSSKLFFFKQMIANLLYLYLWYVEFQAFNLYFNIFFIICLFFHDGFIDFRPHKSWIYIYIFFDFHLNSVF